MFVVDASVAIKWFVEEDGHDQARRLVARGETFTSPDFLLAEMANVIWKKARRREIEEQHAHFVIAAVPRVISTFIPLSQVINRAFQFGLELRHPVYDCIYLATAELAGCRLVTADNEFARKVENGSSRHLILALENA